MEKRKHSSASRHHWEMTD